MQHVTIYLYMYHHKTPILKFLTDENEQFRPLANKDAKQFHSI